MHAGSCRVKVTRGRRVRLEGGKEGGKEGEREGGREGGREGRRK
jgi:hypothetical protein